MWLAVSKILIAVLWLFNSVADAATEQSAARRYTAPVRRPMLRQMVTQCTVPYFQNGEVKVRNRGRMARFDCDRGFQRVGERFASCINGRWDASVPVCAKSGCATLPTVDSGYIMYEKNRATAWLSCLEGTELAGSKNSYCNGTHWDRPLGVCRLTGHRTATWCDFEAESLCGWTNDALHDFDWKRSDGTLNPRALRTGPKYDHTKMQPKAGHYMMVDSAEQFTNDTARFQSPLYEPELSEDACFNFYYHMFGETVGSLRVYVKPASSDLYDLQPSFAIDGNQKNVWHEGHIAIAPQTEPFQIVFEASLGMRYKSDIAIDDVSLLNGTFCRVAVEDGLDNVEDGPADPAKAPVRIESCENRCGISMATVLNDTDTIAHCDCHEDCVINGTCCPDFLELCVFKVVNVSSTTTNAPVVSMEGRTSTTSQTRSTTSTVAASTPTTSTTQTTTAKALTTKPTTASTTTTTTTITTASTTTAASTTTTTTRLTSTTRRKWPSTPASTTSTTQKYNLRPRPFVPMTNAPRVPPPTTRKLTTKLVVTSTSTTSARPTTSTVISVGKLATVQPTQSDMVDELGDNEATTTERLLVAPPVISSFPRESVPPKASLAKFLGYATVGAALFLSILCVSYTYARKSRTGVLARLKEKSQKSCIEDIRFLAGEEDLDFNITQASEAIEEEKKATDGKRANNSHKVTEATGKASDPSAPGKQLGQERHADEKRKSQPSGRAGTGADARRDKHGTDADYDSESDSSPDEEGCGGGTHRTRHAKGTKKAYHKYVKHYDDDMVSTLL